ncbi:hypothetical protein R9C00_16040 [Flammeovirgaceae bacterium SG7u.111]|nr:hypothetical protein [Flammeovirgaceae bacterium SG7u.132]WPO33213.1 hypothetical protein R9C00_16040 [Flammeovirgaceae bacterium SG7u.111]
MKKVSINIVILLAYTVFLHYFLLEESPHDKGIINMIYSSILIFIQVSVNLKMALSFVFRDDNVKAKPYLLSAATVLLLGFSACLGSAQL